MHELIGRSTEREQLIDSIRRVQKLKKGNGIIVAGPPGIGKSTLCNELARNAMQAGLSVLRFHCQKEKSQSALGVVSSSLQDEIGLSFQNTPMSNYRLLRKAIGILNPSKQAKVAWTQLFTTPLPDVYKAAHNLDVPQSELRYLILDQLKQLFIYKASLGTGLLIIVDDFQWIDPTSWSLMNEVGNLVRQTPVVLCVSTRDLAAVPFSFDTIELEPLDPWDSALIIRQVSPELDNTTIENITRNASGNPLYLSELAKTNYQTGKLPTSIVQIVKDRLEDLEQFEHLAAILSCAGSIIDKEIMGVLLVGDQAAIEEGLPLLIEKGILVEDGFERIRFTHDLVKQAVYDGISEDQKRDWHALIGSTMESDRHYEEQPEEIALQYELAGNYTKAINFYKKSGDRALSRSYTKEAEFNYKHALDLHETHLDHGVGRVEIKEKLGTTLVANNGFSTTEVLEFYSDFIEYSKAHGNKTQFFRATAYLEANYLIRAEFKKGEQIASRLLGIANDENNRLLRLYASLTFGACRYWSGDILDAEKWMVEALKYYDEKEAADAIEYTVRELGVAAKTHLAMAIAYRGNLQGGSALLKEAHTRATIINHPFSILYALNTQCLNALLVRDYTTGLRKAGEAMDLLEEFPFPFWRGEICFARGAALASLGRYPEAIKALNEVIDLANAHDTRLGYGHKNIIKAHAHAALKETEKAKLHMDIADTFYQQGPDLYYPEYCRHKALILSSECFEGENIDVSVHLLSGIESSKAGGNIIYEMRCLNALRKHLIARDRVDEVTPCEARLEELKSFIDTINSGQSALVESAAIQ